MTNNIYSGYGAYNTQNYDSAYNRNNKADKTGSKADSNAVTGMTEEDSVKKTEVKGPGTYGNPKLSEKALKYYEKLKKKFGNMDFVLVASDKKQEAEAMKGSLSTPRGMVVLIDTDKIEQMAEDEEYRAKYEGIISNASRQMVQMKNNLVKNGTNVKTFGMTVNDGGNASFFAVIDKSLSAQKERIEKKREQKAADKKADEKKAAKEKAKERQEAHRKEGSKADKEESYFGEQSDYYEVVHADSWEGLQNKIEDVYMSELTNSVRTGEEMNVGQSVDYSI